jgi:hypothetical protein
MEEKARAESSASFLCCRSGSRIRCTSILTLQYEVAYLRVNHSALCFTTRPDIGPAREGPSEEVRACAPPCFSLGRSANIPFYSHACPTLPYTILSQTPTNSCSETRAKRGSEQQPDNEYGPPQA